MESTKQCVVLWYGETPIGDAKSYYEVKDCKKLRAVYWMICREIGCSREMEVVIPEDTLQRVEVDIDAVWLGIHRGVLDPVEGMRRIAKVLESIAGREFVVTVLEEEDFVRIEAV